MWGRQCAVELFGFYRLRVLYMDYMSSGMTVLGAGDRRLNNQAAKADGG